jgi:hypothetical protein
MFKRTDQKLTFPTSVGSKIDNKSSKNTLQPSRIVKSSLEVIKYHQLVIT